jgi:nicotinamidase-related amidase
MMKNDPVLLLIDIQNDYFPGGKMALDQPERAAEQAARLLAVWRRRGWPVIHIAHESMQPEATFFLPGTDGQRIHPLVGPVAGDTVITKNYPNSFARTALHETLGQWGATELTIAGMMTHMCIDATVRAAKDLGFACTLIHDATATRALSFGGRNVAAAQVQTAFLAALATICDRVTDADHIV